MQIQEHVIYQQLLISRRSIFDRFRYCVEFEAIHDTSKITTVISYKEQTDTYITYIHTQHKYIYFYNHLHILYIYIYIPSLHAYLSLYPNRLDLSCSPCQVVGGFKSSKPNACEFVTVHYTYLFAYVSTYIYIQISIYEQDMSYYTCTCYKNL